MNIAIDCRPLQNRYAERGIGTVVRNLLSHLVKSRCSSSLVLCGSAPQPPLRCGRYVMLKRPASHDWLYEQLHWPFDLRAQRAAIFHSTVSLGLIREIGFPLFPGIKSIATVYDLNPLHMPELAPHTRMKSFMVQKMAVRRADRVMTISHYVKNDLVARLGVREDRIRVLPLAVDEAVVNAFDALEKPCPAPPEPFLLALGETQNKNISAVVAVFDRLCDRGFSGSLRVIGAHERQTDAVRVMVASSRYRDRIMFTDKVITAQLVANYASCSLFLFPSLCEGFGLPVIEAMYCGAPVVTSNASSLPEAGGDAALYCDPGDIEGLAAAAGHLLGDQTFRNDLRRRGMAHARRRNWNDAAEMVIGTYEELGAVFSSPSEKG